MGGGGLPLYEVLDPAIVECRVLSDVFDLRLVNEFARGILILS